MGEYDEVSSGDLVDLPNEIRVSRFAEARLKEIDALQQVCVMNAKLSKHRFGLRLS